MEEASLIGTIERENERMSCRGGEEGGRGV
jgi:hypothetical protein